MSLPPLPYQGQDPWFNQRQAYDEAVATWLNNQANNQVYLLNQHNNLSSFVEVVNDNVVDLQGDFTTLVENTHIRTSGRPDIPSTLPNNDMRTRIDLAGNGAMFYSINGPQGAWVWQKRGGVWVCTEGDTGWINVDLVNDWTAGSSGYLRTARYGNIVAITGQDIYAGTNEVFAQHPDGFRPYGRAVLDAMIEDTRTPIAARSNSVSMTMNHTDDTSSRRMVRGLYTTIQSWPTTT